MEAELGLKLTLTLFIVVILIGYILNLNKKFSRLIVAIVQKTQINLPLVILLIAGILGALSFSPFNFSYFIIASILLLFYNVENRKKNSWRFDFVYGFCYGLTYFGLQLYWVVYSLYKIIGTSLFIAIVGYTLFVAFLSIYIGLVVLIYHKCKTRKIAINLVFLFPSIWVLFEWLRGWLLSGFPWSEIGYTQVNVIIFRGLYPLGGSYLVSWLCLSLIGVIYVFLQSLYKRNMSYYSVIRQNRFLYFYFFIIIFGGSYLSQINYTKPYGSPVSVALIQGNVSEGRKWNSNDFLAIYKKLIAKAKADIIVIPETAISSFKEYLPNGYLDKLIKIAKSNNANLIVGIPKIINDQKDYMNTALVLTDPRKSYYSKYHLVPFGEYIPIKWLLSKFYSTINLPMVNFSAGAENQLPLIAGAQKIAFNICYENGFGAELIKSASQSFFMANISDMIWFDGAIAKDEHLQISEVRALENQRYYIQTTNTGLTAIIKPDGEIQGILPSSVEKTLFGNIQGRIGTTPFEQVGNYPIILFCLLLVILILAGKLGWLKNAAHHSSRGLS